MEGKNLPNEKVSTIHLKQLLYENSSECSTSEPERQSDDDSEEEKNDMRPIISNNMGNPQNSSMSYSYLQDELIYLPEDFKKSIHILQYLNSKVRSFSFISPSASGEEELIDEHFWSKIMKEKPNGTGTSSDDNLKLKRINEKSCDKQSVENISSPSYAQICEFKDAMKDAVMQLKLI